MKEFWDNYRYTDPVAAALEAAFGVKFYLENTGGGCVCLHGDIDADTYILVGSAADGPLLRDEERSDFPFHGGWHIGVYEDVSGYTLGDAYDYTAMSADEVVLLAKTALELVPRHTDDTRVVWQRDAAGDVTEERWPR